METTVRTLTVYRGFRSNGPRIHMEARYLAKAGFRVGSKFSVLVEPNRVTMTAEPNYPLECTSRRLIDLSKLRIKPGDIIVQFQDYRGFWRKEILKTVPEGKFFRVAKFPHRITGLAKGDLINAWEHSGLLFFGGVVEFGSNQTLQVLFKNARYVCDELLEVVNRNGCATIYYNSHGSTINVPLSAKTRALYCYLDDGVERGYWSYRKFTLGEMY